MKHWKLIFGLLVLSVIGNFAPAAEPATPAPLAWNEVRLLITPPTTHVDGSPLTRPITYRIETKSPGGDWRTVLNTTSTSPKHTGLRTGTHEWRVYAVVNGVEASVSNTISRTVSDPPPSAAVLAVEGPGAQPASTSGPGG